MKLLSIDSSSSLLYAAVCDDDTVYCSRSEADMKQSELVIEIIDSLMTKASIQREELQGVLCTEGPGSFTGLRIGFSAAKSLALALSIPFTPVPTLDCIASGIKRITKNNDVQDERIIRMPVIQARKTSFFFAFFNEEERITQDKEMSATEIEDEIMNMFNFNKDRIFITGPASSALCDSFSGSMRKENNIILSNFENVNYASEAITIAKKRNLLDNDNTAYLYSSPAYLRLTDAERKLT